MGKRKRDRQERVSERIVLEHNDNRRAHKHLVLDHNFK